MAKLHLTLGAQVTCSDKPGGKLAKIVVDPATHQVSNLILEQGLLFKKARVVPVAALATAQPGALHLDLPAADLAECAEYREVEIREPAPEARGAPAAANLLAGNGATAPAALPMIRKRLRQGVAADQVLLTRKTRVENLTGALGRLAHVVMDGATGKVVELVMRRGLFPGGFVVPSTAVEGFEDGCVLVSLVAHEVEALPRYAPLSDADITAQVRQALLRTSPWVFAPVDVAVHAGTVHLTGQVASQAVKLHAEELAYLVPCVFDVRNDLVVPGHPVKPGSLGTPGRKEA